MRQILLFTVACGVAFFAHGAESITIVTENWKPYNYEEGGIVKGSSTEIVRAVMERANLPHTIAVYPWARAYRMAQQNESVLIYTIVRMPPREGLFKWVRPVAVADRVSFYRLAGSKEVIVNSLEDAKKYRLGIVRDSMTHKFLTSHGFDVDKDLALVTRQRQNVKKLLANRLDLIAFSDNNIAEQMATYGIAQQKLEEVFFLFKTHPYMAFSKSTSDEVVAKVAKAYDELVTEGTIAKFE